MTPAAVGALRFLRGCLPALRPRTIATRPDYSPPVLVWTDGACENRGAQQDVGFVLAVPLQSAPPLPQLRSPAHYTWYHGCAAVPADLRAALLQRTQYIGQDELLGALLPYLSAPWALAGRRVVHWIDNTAALAALLKGYSRVADSARIVHAFHAWNAGAEADVWFEHVPSAANLADEPSRAASSSRVCSGSSCLGCGPRPSPVSSHLPPS